MSSTELRPDGTTGARAGRSDYKLEVIVIPVSDVDRAAEFYDRLGWRVDADFRNGDARLLQFTPPGSPCSVIFGTGVSPSTPGSSQFMVLAVTDIEAARQELVDKGVDASEVYHDGTGGYAFFDPDVRAPGPDPDRRSYASYVTFNDPDGNGWMLQELTTRLPGRIDSGVTGYASTSDLAGALRRAAAAHGEHEKRSGGEYDENWPDWYAAYLVAEQSGADLPQ
ncbi:catechol 2,3-dioxygenase-like lactoylglutathione lyase family enzyme [Kribbella amoyensis]|uniref:Catechol 2,3-dioxygenase-like lactoylglutathione lyase family enzyme n=1 Tax=Kribbella amoyensis TaxID=996641 RepID=A0A561BSE5_9ACTN|nr:VOC family protein [Kribbella amoyensis]TWD81739.1 catechol 2,3-dioxygenase-like lactoylglutathione lyase family enzyme [Kribbella amoyensis]